MLPRTLSAFSYTLRGAEVVPAFFDAKDHVFIRAVLDEYQAFYGEKRRFLHDRLQKPLAVRGSRGKLAILRHVLDVLTRDETKPPVDPVLARKLVFRAAQGRSRSREAVLIDVGRELGLSALDVEEALFADLPREQRVGPLPKLAPEDIVLDSNLAIAATLLRRAVRVRVQIHGHASAVVRHAQRTGLICSATPVGLDSVELEISGPFALFRHTVLYARALAALLSGLAACYEWELEAACAVESGPTLHRLVLSDRDPLPRRPATIGTTRIAERFLRDFGPLTDDWDVVADPQAIQCGASLSFPDIELLHREHGERWFLEIIGFSTPDSLERKLKGLSEAGHSNVILCFDTNRQCGADVVPDGIHVIGYRHRIDARQVLAIIQSRALSRKDVA